jgi:Uma2 family endonuclease
MTIGTEIVGEIAQPTTEEPGVPLESLYRFSVKQYRAMAREGILTDDDPVELLEGLLVCKITKYRSHTLATGLLQDALAEIVVPRCYVDAQEPVTTSDSEPEPDILVVRGTPRDYLDRQPGPDEVVLVVEVADTTLRRDRGVKKRIYAAARLPIYWIVNLKMRRIEVFTHPTGPAARPTYAHRRDYGPEEAVPVVIDNTDVGRIRVQDILP